MPRTASYSEFLTSYKGVSGEDEVDIEVAKNLNTSFRKHLRYGKRAAPWIEHLKCEARTISAGVLPYSQSGKLDIEVCWGVYPTDPYALPAPKRLKQASTADGIRLMGAGTATSVYVKFLGDEPQFLGDEYSASKAYNVGDVVFYTPTCDYYKCTASSTGNLPTNESYFSKLTFSRCLLDFLAHACFSDTLRKSDSNEADKEYLYARRWLAGEQFILTQGQNEFPEIDWKTNNNQQNRR